MTDFNIRRLVWLWCPLQEAAINVFSTMKKYINDQTIRKLVLPKAKSLFTKSTNVRVGITRSVISINWN